MLLKDAMRRRQAFKTWCLAVDGMVNPPEACILLRVITPLTDLVGYGRQLIPKRTLCGVGLDGDKGSRSLEECIGQPVLPSTSAEEPQREEGKVGNTPPKPSGRCPL